MLYIHTQVMGYVWRSEGNLHTQFYAPNMNIRDQIPFTRRCLVHSGAIQDFPLRCLKAFFKATDPFFLPAMSNLSTTKTNTADTEFYIYSHILITAISRKIVVGSISWPT